MKRSPSLNEPPPPPQQQPRPPQPPKPTRSRSGRSAARFDPQEMSLRGRIGAYRLHATHDPRETTKRARAAFDERFLRQVDPEGVLPEAERRRRAHYARKVYFAQLALRRVAKRRRLPPAVHRHPPPGTPSPGAPPDPRAPQDAQSARDA